MQDYYPMMTKQLLIRQKTNTVGAIEERLSTREIIKDKNDDGNVLGELQLQEIYASELLEYGKQQHSEVSTEVSTPTTSEGKKQRPKRNDTQRKKSVITTPTKNRFDGLDTENELQRAFLNLQDLSQPLTLATIPEQHEKYFSDGSGTRSKSTMGLPRTRTEPNSDEEEDGAPNEQNETNDNINRRNQYSPEPKRDALNQTS